jgi:hypothetical protein
MRETMTTPDSGCDLNGWHGDTLYYDGFPVAGVYASRGSWVAYYDDAKPEGARTFPRRIAAQVAAEGWVRERLAARLPTPTAQGSKS